MTNRKIDPIDIINENNDNTPRPFMYSQIQRGNSALFSNILSQEMDKIKQKEEAEKEWERE